MFLTITPCCFLADSSKNVISMELNAQKMYLHSLLECLSLLPIFPSSLPRLKKKINKISSVIFIPLCFSFFETAVVTVSNCFLRPPLRVNKWFDSQWVTGQLTWSMSDFLLSSVCLLLPFLELLDSWRNPSPPALKREFRDIGRLQKLPFKPET